ncbi:MAG: glycosyltransferase family 2 protein [Fusobacteriaceae bacterium]
MGLAVAIMTCNEEKNLKRTLSSIHKLANEIIIIDSGSTDNTESIAKEFGAKFYTEKWKGYGKQRNSVIAKCTQEWILNIDADEEVSPELFDNIKKIVEEPTPDTEKVYEINRVSFCFGKKLKHGGWGTSYAIRLFTKDGGHFNDNTVHEEFVTSISIQKLKGDLYHHSYLTLEDYFSKFNRYTTEGALDYYRKGKKSSIFQIVFNPLYKFIKMYIIRLGFLDGIEGFVISVTSALYSMVKYFKLREMYLNNSYKDKIKY